MTYSQSQEEKWILDAVGDRSGSFLDIGANDGHFASNTLALVEKGWPGVLVEPSRAFDNLLARHGRNQRLRLVHAAVGVSHRLAPFWEAGLLSTSEARNYMNWRGQVEFSEPFYVPQATVVELVDEFPAILDGGKLLVVSIDTEGTSVEIFERWPWDRVKPLVIVLEYDDRLDRVTALADGLGYTISYTSAENVVLVDGGERP